MKRDDPISLRKLAGEGQLTNHKTCLGWYIKTHSLRALLPEEKQTARTTDIKEALVSTKIKTDTLKLLIGKINHVEHVMQPER